MATVTPGYTFTNNEVVTPANLNALGVPTISNIGNPDLASSTQESLVPVSAVLPFARLTAPAGWLIANGDSVPNGIGTVQGVTANFSLLYAAVGNSFGSAGKIPDLRGYFVRGSGVNADTTTGAGFGLKQSDAIISHTHTTDSVQQSHNHYTVADTPYGGSWSFSQYKHLSRGYQIGATEIVPTLGLTSDVTQSHTHTTNTQNPLGEVETRPRNIAMLYCIKF
jgi:hypothetical protein